VQSPASQQLNSLAQYPIPNNPAASQQHPITQQRQQHPIPNNLAALAASHNPAASAAPPTTPTPSAAFLADLPRRKSRQQRAYNASALPNLCPLPSTSIYGSYEYLIWHNNFLVN